MSMILGYITNAAQGLERYFVSNQLVVLLIAVFLTGWLAEKKAVGERGNRMLVYSLIMCVLLVCPVTAAVILIYQTGFYDYEWAWSLVPVTAMLAYGAVLLLDKHFQKRRVLLGIVIMAALLFLCGNQGAWKQVGSIEKQAKADTQEILQYLEAEEESGEIILWAPKEIMQEVRRQDGKILLVYGRDMWDVKSGAYDYEAYNESVIGAYTWLENMVQQERQVTGSEEASELFEDLCREQQLDEEMESFLWVMVEEGVNTIVLPELTADYMQDTLFSIASQRGLAVEMTDIEEYTIYLLK